LDAFDPDNPEIFEDGLPDGLVSTAVMVSTNLSKSMTMKMKKKILII
jgi:hypothetical protein